MRSYLNTVILEEAIDLIPSGNTTLLSYVYPIFNPLVNVVQADCGTLLGEILTLNLDLLGRVELSTGLRFTRATITAASLAGQTQAAIRSLSTCVASVTDMNGNVTRGVCQKCFSASFPNKTLPAVGSSVIIPPEFVIQIDQLVLAAGSTTGTLSFTPDQYDSIILFKNGSFWDPSNYTISGNIVTFTNPLTGDPGSGYGTITVQYIVVSTVPFVNWLAETYSGSLVGLDPLPRPLLSLPKLLLSSLVPSYNVESLATLLMNSPLTSVAVKQYLPNINDPLEKGVLVSLLNAILLT